MEPQVLFKSNQDDALHVVELLPNRFLPSVYKGRERVLPCEPHITELSFDFNKRASLRRSRASAFGHDRHGEGAPSRPEALQNGQTVKWVADTSLDRQTVSGCSHQSCPLKPN